MFIKVDRMEMGSCEKSSVPQYSTNPSKTQKVFPSKTPYVVQTKIYLVPLGNTTEQKFPFYNLLFIVPSLIS